MTTNGKWVQIEIEASSMEEAVESSLAIELVENVIECELIDH